MKFSAIARSALCASILLMSATAFAAKKGSKEVNEFPNATRAEPKAMMSEREQRDLSKAGDFVNDGKGDQAMPIIDKVLGASKLSKYAEAYALQLKGRVYWDADNEAEALAATIKAIETDALPNAQHFGLMYQVVQMYVQDEKYDEALTWLDRWEKATGQTTADALALKSNVFYRLERYEDAIATMKQALAKTDTPNESWNQILMASYYELDQYDDAELVRKKTAAMFAGFVTRQSPEDNLMGEGAADGEGISLAGLEPGTLQILEPGEDIKFSDPADVGGSYSEFLRTQFRAVAAAIGITYEQLTGDLTGVNYSSIRAGMLEFRRRCEMVQHGVLVHQMCRPVWAAWMKQAVLAGALDAPGFARGGAARRRQYLQAKWIPQGWQWVDPEKEFKAMLLAIRAGLMSRSEAISAFGYDAEDVDREIAADNQRADDLGLIFDSDPRRTSKDGGSAEPNRNATDAKATPTPT